MHCKCSFACCKTAQEPHPLSPPGHAQRATKEEGSQQRWKEGNRKRKARTGRQARRKDRNRKIIFNLVGNLHTVGPQQVFVEIKYNNNNSSNNNNNKENTNKKEKQ